MSRQEINEMVCVKFNWKRDLYWLTIFWQHDIYPLLPFSLHSSWLHLNHKVTTLVNHSLLTTSPLNNVKYDLESENIPLFISCNWGPWEGLHRHWICLQILCLLMVSQYCRAWHGSTRGSPVTWLASFLQVSDPYLDPRKYWLQVLASTWLDLWVKWIGPERVVWVKYELNTRRNKAA